MSQPPRHDTVPMSRDDIDRLRLASAFDVPPEAVTSEAITVASRVSLGGMMQTDPDHG